MQPGGRVAEFVGWYGLCRPEGREPPEVPWLKVINTTAALQLLPMPSPHIGAATPLNPFRDNEPFTRTSWAAASYARWPLGDPVVARRAALAEQTAHTRGAAK